MKVIDLFCGCGGISLGFKMAGFSVIYGLDNNKDAIQSFERNFPLAKAVTGDIGNLDIRALPEADIIVGGPPCVNFSTSKGSRANVLEGLKLVQSFLRIIYLCKPKYWLMENVPRVGLHLPDHIPLSWIGIKQDGFLEVPVRKLFRIAEYGAPQGRERLLIGNFPIPNTTHISEQGSLPFEYNSPPMKTLWDVLKSFPSPTEPFSVSKITDPIYEFTINTEQLTDHYYDTCLDDIEVKKIRNAKENHPYMGFMPFPDKLDRPARTVVSLQMGRETIVVPHGSDKYRRLTVRECASLQTFPITFQFAGNTIASRYKQAGNAVPPILTFHIAKSIAEKESIKTNTDFTIGSPLPFSVPNVLRKKKVRKVDYSKPRKINFPGKELRGFRIEFVSKPNCSDTEWSLLFHQGEGKKNHFVLQAQFDEIDRMVRNSIKKFRYSISDNYTECIKKCHTLPAINSHELHCHIHDTYGDVTKEFTKYSSMIDKHFPKEEWGKVDIGIVNPFDGLTRSKLRIRLLVSMMVAKIIETNMY